MIRHIVILRPSAETTPEQVETVLRRLDVLVTEVPGMLNFHLGTNVNTLPGLDQGFSYAFTIDFADASARDAYYESAGHICVAEHLQPFFANGLEDLIMFQIEL